MIIRGLVVDDHAVVRTGLRLLLDTEEDIEPVGEAGNARDAIFQAGALKPDVILLDVVMPARPASRCSRSLCTSPGREGADPLDAGRAALRARGLRGRRQRLRPQGGRGHEVGSPVRHVAGGGRYVHPNSAPGSTPPRPRRRRLAEADPLSDRAREILRLLALGHTNQEIAKMLYISVRTAETHRAHIMQKLRLQTRADLVAYAPRARPPRSRVARAALDHARRPPGGGPRCP